MNKAALIQKLQEVLAVDEVQAHQKGYRWYAANLMPCLYYSNWPADQQPLIADIWYMANAIHQVNRAPLAAIQAAESALKLDPEHLDAMYELIDLYVEVGQYQQAFELVNQVIKLDPEDEELLFTKQNIQDALNYNESPLYSEDDPIWPFYEQLAQGQYTAFLASAKIPGDLIDEWYRCRAAAYAATHQWQDYLGCWKKIAEIETPVELTAFDWFYMPERVFQEEQFWKLIGQKALATKPNYLDN